jgi:hypothetical protein
LITNMKSYGESIDNVNKKFIEAIIKDYN